ncbi:MAG: hypothetical protein PHH83_02010, partial [Patescibacteria group bacterium]|nr:hypothetical protein [Patescibacteria group bacterium]
SLIDVINVIENILGYKIRVKYLSARNFDLKYNVLDIKKACKLLKWQPKYQLHEGIKKLYKEINC